MKKLKKGFTLVELVIVIAVIAVLAAVLIPTFSGIIQRSKVSADTSLVKNLNTIMATIDQDVPETMSEVVEVVEANGIAVTKMTATASGYNIVYDHTSNRFALLDASNKVSYQDTAKTVDTNKLYALWKVVQTNQSFNDSIFSIYLAGDTRTGVANINGVGIDVGDNKGITTVNYTNTLGDVRDVFIRTNGQMSGLKVDAQNDSVDHYGFANVVYVVKVANSSFHEYGIVNSLVAEQGHVVIESTGTVIKAAQTEQATSTFTNDGGNVLSTSAKALTVTQDSSTSALSVSEETGASETQFNISGTESTPNTLNINSLDQLMIFRDATNSGNNFAGMTVNLLTDITLTESWVPASNYSRDPDNDTKWFAGTFDGNGHTISGLTNKDLKAEDLNNGHNDTTPKEGTEYTYGFFGAVNNAIITDITFTNVNIQSLSDLKLNNKKLLGDSVATCVGFYNVTNIEENLISISDITVSVNSSVSGYDDVGGIVGMVRNATKVTGTYFNIDNCTFGGTINAVRRGAGLIAQLSNAITATVTDCTVTGTVTGAYDSDYAKTTNYDYYMCAGLVAFVNGLEHYTFSGCTSTMNVTSQLTGKSGITGSPVDQFAMKIVSGVSKTGNFTDAHITGNTQV